VFYCVVCRGSFVLDDVQKGRYFPSSGVCLVCYQSMSKSKDTCFGKLYDKKSIVCQSCPDRNVCTIFVVHPNNSMEER
jgi:hypothetical protein